MSEKKGTRGWVIVVIVAIIGLAFYLAGEQAVDELTASGQVQTTEQVER